MINHDTYSLLNDLADQGGVVIFGGSEDANIPLCELKQAFSLNSPLYNRSFENLSLENAAELYDRYVAPLCSECLLLHVGDMDKDLFKNSSEKFDQLVRELIRHIRSFDKKCEIALISIKNPDGCACISEMNKHLKYIADSEHCQYGDITTKRVWNPKETQTTVSFVYSTGFVRSLKNKHPINNMIKVLFTYNQSTVSR